MNLTSALVIAIALVLVMILTSCASKGEATFKGHSCLACVAVEIEIKREEEINE